MHKDVKKEHTKPSNTTFTHTHSISSLCVIRLQCLQIISASNAFDIVACALIWALEDNSLWIVLNEM